MSITPRGMTIQEAYRLYRENRLLVNRKYQRKLVWFLHEKQSLIESILKGYPIPLILLAEHAEHDGKGIYEIIDGIQRLNAIFSYIEQNFSYKDKYFDIKELARAKQHADEKDFIEVSPLCERLSRTECANFVDYQLAVTIFPATKESEITDVFGRINSGGQRLSPQDRRQAGVVTNFSQLVRSVSSQIRGDVSRDTLPLTRMPEISIEHPQDQLGYSIKAEDTLWVKQGVITIKQLRESEDEQIIADLASSVLLNKPIAASQELYDDLYSPDNELSKQVENALAVYKPSRLSQELISTFSVLKDTIENFSSERFALRKQVNPKSGNPIKNIFYTIFMAFFKLVVEKQKTPVSPCDIMQSLYNLSSSITISAHYSKTEDRVRNIDITKGLIEKHFVTRNPPSLGHGPGLIIDFENSLRRSKIESAKYEFKQGILQLSSNRQIDKDLLDRIIETICGIANVGPQCDGYLFFGVCDTEQDAKRVKELDSITPLLVGEHNVVGIDREAKKLKKKLDNYIQIIIKHIQNSSLTNPLKTQILANIDTFDYKGLSVLRIRIPIQNDISFVGKVAFTRIGNSTVKVEGPDLLALNAQFKK
ncbi:DUF262 domain-containing protein [Heliobacterium chlorum]|uniref:DUF262 domain-containing protein n=1 Tax=Heliobacterium chlorum TaxID=2698 RepID=A0ABR7T8K6_HELCL|nr:DUF262 domain-containing protein [Heliobacterium chlorum]MBC9786612.1 DUF262 domain-containing protein [Heliobacterium chlorum]